MQIRAVWEIWSSPSVDWALKTCHVNLPRPTLRHRCVRTNSGACLGVDVMRLGKCLVSSDLNPLYLDFFPITFRAWRDLVGVEVQLILISDHIPSALKSYDKHIILVPPIRGVHTGFQAQCVRILMPQLCKVADDQAILISDIDMVPMNARYYLEPLADMPDQNFVIFRSNALSHLEEIAICYNAASPNSWRELVGEIRDIDDMRNRIEEWSAAASYDGIQGGSGWSTDQRLLHEFVSKFELKKSNPLYRRKPGVL